MRSWLTPPGSLRGSCLTAGWSTLSQVVDTFSLAAGHLRRPEWRDLWVETMAYLADDIGRLSGVGLMYGLPAAAPAVRRSPAAATMRCRPNR